MRQRGSRGLEPRWRECATETGDAPPPPDHRAVGKVMQAGRQIAGSDRVEVIVVAVDPKDRSAERLVVPASLAMSPTHSQGGNLGMALDKAPGVGERAVKSPRAPNSIGYRLRDRPSIDRVSLQPDYLLALAGTSRSALSQTKSSLL